MEVRTICDKCALDFKTRFVTKSKRKQNQSWVDKPTSEGGQPAQWDRIDDEKKFS